MSSSSPRWRETARNLKGALLQRLRDEATQTEIARELGVHKSTVNRLVNEHADHLLAMLAYMGGDIAWGDVVMVPRDELRMLTSFAARGIQTMVPDDNKAR